MDSAGNTAIAEVSRDRRRDRLYLDRDTPTALALSDAFGAIVDYAGECAGAVAEEPVAAVHEYRKSMRRARAVLALSRTAMAEPNFGELLDGLRRITRPTSVIRDRDVFPGLLQSMGLPALAAVASDEAYAPVSPAERRAVLEACAELALAMPPVFRQGMPGDGDGDILRQGLTASYRRARQSLRDALASGKVKDFHRFRKRTKELGYQLELLGAGAELSRDDARWRRSYNKLATRLGAATDRIELARHLGRHARGRKEKRLVRKLRKRGKKLAREELRSARPYFAAKPKKFARRALRRLALEEAA